MGKGKGEMIWENGIETCILSYVKWIASPGSMHSSNCCFLTCIQMSQEGGQVVWYSHLFQNFPQFIMIHTVKGFGIVNKAEIDVFLELSCFFHDPLSNSRGQRGSLPQTRRGLTLLSQLCRDPAVGVRNAEEA